MRLIKGFFGKRIIIMLSLFLFCFMYGCKTYYGEGMAGGDYSYMHTPMTQEGEKVAKHYIGSRYVNDIEYYRNEKNEFFEMSYHYGMSKAKISGAIGAGLYFGNYKVSNLQGNLAKMNGNYNYYGGTIRGKVAYNWMISPKFHWRVFGVQGMWHMERGSFHDFKRDMLDMGDFEDEETIKDFMSWTRDLSNFSIYPYTELAFKLNDSFSITPSFGVGYKVNSFVSFRDFMSLNISYREKVNVWASVQQVTPGLDKLINDDFVNKPMGDGTNIQVGISLAF